MTQGVKPGMAILGVGSKQVRTPADFATAIQDLTKRGARTALLDVYDEAGVALPTVALTLPGSAAARKVSSGRP